MTSSTPMATHTEITRPSGGRFAVRFAAAFRATDQPVRDREPLIDVSSDHLIAQGAVPSFGQISNIHTNAPTCPPSTLLASSPGCRSRDRMPRTRHPDACWRPAVFPARDRFDH
jgi:hypothetical protein